MLEWPNCRLIISILYLQWVFKNYERDDYIQSMLFIVPLGPTLPKKLSLSIFSVKLELM